MLFKMTGRGLPGIMASGTALGVPYKNRHWNGTDSIKNYSQVRLNRLTDYTKGQILSVNHTEDFGFAHKRQAVG